MTTRYHIRWFLAETLIHWGLQIAPDGELKDAMKRAFQKHLIEVIKECKADFS